MIVTTLVGNLGRDPEIRDVSGRSVCKFSVASDIRRKTVDGEWDKVTRWYNISVWGKRGNTCKEMLRKGSKVQVVGEATLRQWQGEQGLRTDYEIDAWHVEFLSDFGRRASGGGGEGGSQGSFEDGDIPF